MNPPVSPERAAQIRRLFDAVVELAPAERAAVLDREDDPTLRREVESLLAAYDRADEVLHALEPPTAAAADPLVGRQVSHYQITEKLGGGGMGVVYKARDLKLDRTVALKFLPPHLSVDEEAKARFIQEAKAASALDHPHIAVVHEIDETKPAPGEPGEGRLFIAMTCYEGETLKKKIARGPLPVEETVAYAVQMAEGLQRAHEAGIVHRDVKPANVMVTERGRVKLVDFGLAKVQDVSLTQTGMALGTVAYMSPEQARGEAVDHRTDLWSLGVVLYELLTGQRPFRGESAEVVLYAIRHDAPEPGQVLRPEVPEALAQVVERLLSKDPAERYQHAEEVLADLRALHRGAERPFPQMHRFGSSRQKRMALATLALLVLLLVSFGQIFWQRSSGSAAPTPPERATPSVAVLPLKNFSGEAEQEYFADGMTEELITTLAKIGALRVIAHRSVLQFKDSDRPVPEIAQALQVDYVVEGSVQQDGERVRITANLIDAEANTPVWGERFEREMRNMLALQRDVALAIAQQIEVTLTPEDRERLGEVSEVDPVALDLYVKGMQARAVRTDEGFGEAVGYFEQAIAADPGYAPAYAGLASALYFSGRCCAQQHAEKALELDPNLAEAYVVLGLIREQYEWDWAGAEEAFRQAIRMKPGYAEAHHELSMFLIRLKRFNEALSAAQHTLYLNPLSVRFQHGLAEVYLFSRGYDEAIDAAQKARGLDSSYAPTHWTLGMAYGLQGRYEEAEETLKKGFELGNLPCLALLGLVYIASDRREEALEILERLKERSKKNPGAGYIVAWLYAGLEEREQALEWLERAAEIRSFGCIYLGVDPQFDALRSEPRFQALLKKMGLGA